MATYKQVAQLVREGKSPSAIIHALNVYPSRLERIFKAPRFKRLLQTDLLLAGALAATVRMAAAGDIIVQLAKLASSDNEKVSLQASLAVLREIDKPTLGASRRAMAALEIDNPPPPVNIFLDEPAPRLFRNRPAKIVAGSAPTSPNHAETHRNSTKAAPIVQNCREL